VRAEEPTSEGEVMLTIDINNFDDTVNNHLFTVVEFYAQWWVVDLRVVVTKITTYLMLFWEAFWKSMIGWLASDILGRGMGNKGTDGRWWVDAIFDISMWGEFIPMEGEAVVCCAGVGRRKVGLLDGTGWHQWRTPAECIATYTGNST
jgi:hypothetical protein